MSHASDFVNAENHAREKVRAEDLITYPARSFKSTGRQQTNPPTVPISELFPNGDFPKGQIMSYKDE